MTTITGVKVQNFQNPKLKKLKNLQYANKISTINFPSVDKLCKQFGPRSGPTNMSGQMRSKLFDTLMVFF